MTEDKIHVKPVDETDYLDSKLLEKISGLPKSDIEKAISSWQIAYRKKHAGASNRQVFRATKKHFNIKS